ncbi:sulfatase-like hydrolase/transferase [Rhodopirellula sp. SWK7]|uniref:sulfatase-like hydrolase/transferase n=1 Tax=Rhodopirellula sp. SWK7 TaxID=595460 RepID=UPI0002BE1873|nr:sulfatase-like hydrolase/transferase [Rhodopirellula sp. SWK7]EMI43313.1 N-acetylgalactosamine 6-sulfate sulfatase (GALNS) [Rhodopirellula sp. SWK7]
MKSIINAIKSTLLLAGLLHASPAALQAADTPPPSAKPNIVFIYADDWGWGDLSCHGSTWVQTPNIDQLASEGVDFQQFNVLNPVCSPSRVAAMTGRYPSRYGVNSVFGARRPGPEQPDWLDPKAPTTPRYLKAAGYRTAHFGKWHMGEKPDNPPMSAYGFDESAVFHGPGPGIKSHEIAGRAAQFIEANKDHPFFVDVWIHESHTAHSPTPEALEKWKDVDDEQKRIYAAVITDGDNNVGKVLAALDKAGVAQNTIVVFSSDNGPERTSTAKGSPGKYGSYYSVGETGGMRGRKRNLFEGGVRTPFIVRWPGHMTAGRKNETTVFSAVDLLPTFCAAAGVTLPADAQCDGENLIAAFKGEIITRTRPIFWLHTGAGGEPDGWPRLAVRDGDWKLVTTYDGQRVELHNMKTDRAEDIAKDQSKEHPELVSRLTKMALDWKATLPTKANPTCLSSEKHGAKRAGENVE